MDEFRSRCSRRRDVCDIGGGIAARYEIDSETSIVLGASCGKRVVEVEEIDGLVGMSIEQVDTLNVV